MKSKKSISIKAALWVLFLLYSNPTKAQDSNNYPNNSGQYTDNQDDNQWIDMGVKADNGAVLLWSAGDLIDSDERGDVLPMINSNLSGSFKWTESIELPYEISGDSQYDIVTNMLGQPYRIPTQREFLRLINNCEYNVEKIRVEESHEVINNINYDDISWIYGKWTCSVGNPLNFLDTWTFLVSIQNNWLECLCSTSEGTDVICCGPVQISGNTINCTGPNGSIWHFDKRERYIYEEDNNGIRRVYHNLHNVVRRNGQTDAIYRFYLKLVSKINGNKLYFPLDKYYDTPPYEASMLKPYWTATKGDGKKAFSVCYTHDKGLVIREDSIGMNCFIRPVYDESYLQPDKYESKYGWINVKVNNFNECPVDVYLDNQRIGRAPLANEYRVNVGEHTIKLVGDCVSSKSNSVTFTLKNRQTLYRNLAVVSKYANVTIYAPHCQILIDRVTKGDDKWSGKLEEGKHSITLNRRSYKTVNQDIEIDGGESYTYNMEANEMKLAMISLKSSKSEFFILDDKTQLVTGDSIQVMMESPHTLKLFNNNCCPLQVDFEITDDGVNINEEKYLTDYMGNVSRLKSFNNSVAEFEIETLNKKLYYGQDKRYKKRPNYDGPFMGYNSATMLGLSFGYKAFSIDYTYYSKIRLCGLASIDLIPSALNDTLIPCFEFDCGYELLRGTGLRIIPYAGIKINRDNYALSTRLSFEYPITDYFVMGISPLLNFWFKENDEYHPISYGIALTLGFQKCRN